MTWQFGKDLDLAQAIVWWQLHYNAVVLSLSFWEKAAATLESANSVAVTMLP